MAATGTIFREVMRDSNQKWMRIIVPIGEGSTSVGHQAEHKTTHAGGYGYNDSGRVGSPCRNRFIYWRCYQDILELVEDSLDFDLKANGVQFRFSGASVVGDVNIHESHGNVVVLATTTTSVHRMIFPHPNRLQKSETGFLAGAEKTVPSIFTDASVTRVKDPGNFHNFNLIGLTSAYQIHASSSWLTKSGESIFAMATSTGSILVVKLPAYGIQGIATQHELKQSSMMQRLWTGIVPSAIRGGGEYTEMSTSLLLHPMGQDVFVFAVCRDHKLRMWSTKNYDCVMAADLLEFMPNNSDPATLTLGDEGHIIRRSVASSMQALFIGIFMSFSDRCQFCVFQPVFADGRYQLNHMTSVFGPQDDMVDFCLTESFLWILWTSTHGETYATCASIEYNRPGIQNMRSITMETSEPGELTVPSQLEPREFYMDQVFYPGRFSIMSILKALNIFKRSMDNSQIPDTSVPIQALKAEVMAVVEHEIHSSASDYNISEEEYQDLQVQQWARFYSCCVQYQDRSTKSIGLFADNDSGMVSVIKKETISFYRSCDHIEHLSLTALGECHLEDFDADLYEEEPLFRDVIQLCESLKLLRLCLTDEMIYSFEQDLYHTQRPLTVAESIFTCLMNEAESGEQVGSLEEVFISLQHIQDVDRATSSLIDLLDLVHNAPDYMMEEMGVDTSRHLSLSRLFASESGIKLLSRAVHQMAQSRLDLSRDLLVLLTMVTNTPGKAGISRPVVDEIQSGLLGRVCLLVRAYFVVKWSSEVLVTAATSGQVEANVRLLEVLGIRDTMESVSAQKLNDSKDSMLLELFLASPGGQKVREYVAQDSVFDENPCTLWTKGFMPVVIATAQVLWPFNPEVVFPEFLISHCQYTALQEFVRLTRDWCEMNKFSQRFFSGLAYFSSGEAQKAVDCFLEVPHDVSSEPFLRQLVEKEDSEDIDPQMVYYLRVLGLLEQFQYPHLAVSIAKKATSIAAEDDPFVPTLWSKVFKNELEMGHNEEAYTAMLANPDKDRRRDCLRQFLVVLCERSELQTLVSLPYRDRHVVLEDEVVSILESRARSIDLSKQNYYDLLYAFHVFRQNYRKAGSIMYEYGMRLGREIGGLKGLQKQAKCYLAALNSLRLVSPDYAWIVKPLSSTKHLEDEDNQSPKRDSGEEFKFSKKRQLEVLELDAIEKEYMLVHARLQLLQHGSDPGYITGPTSHASETIGLLVSAGLFDSAVNICKMFKMPLTPVFEGLASRCVNLAENSQPFMQGDNEYTSEAWKWLQHNDLAPANAIRETSSTDHAWRFLQHYLTLYEDGGSIYHKSVTVKFLSQGFVLPTWLAESYKRLNGAELLRLYLDYDLLEEASHLTLEFIRAVLGKGKEYFGLKTYLHSGAPAVWLPYTSIDQLLVALDEVQTEPHYTHLYNEIQDQLGEYFDVLRQVSQDTIHSEAMRIQPVRRYAHDMMES